MKISLLQPKILRGNVEHNVNNIQNLIDKSKGDLLVLPEYALTGSLVLDLAADINKWVIESEQAKKTLIIPKNKLLLINTLIKQNNEVYNCSEFCLLSEKQLKVYPDDTEKSLGICAGKEHNVFQMFHKKFKVLICMDFKYWTEIDTADLDFILFIYHFTKQNYEGKLSELKDFVKQRKIPVIASSLVSDVNNGFSTYLSENAIVTLPEVEGILEIEL